MAAAVDNAVPPNANAESKSARKKAAKAAASAAVNGSTSLTPALPADVAKDSSATADSENTSEHPYLRELQKQIRNVGKKLSGTQKVDAIISENPGVSLDDLVAQRKINADQKAAALKKPQLQAQLAQLEEQTAHYRKFDSDYQARFAKQKDDLTTAHQKELEEARTSASQQATQSATSELRKKLLTFSQFLRAAAAKRASEEDVDTDESRAFEGALLLVYGGDEKAVDTAISLIEGRDELVPTIEGMLTKTSYAQVKQASVEHAPFQSEEAWVDQVNEARAGELQEDAHAANGSDPTVVNAGLTELEPGSGGAIPQTNGMSNGEVQELSAEAAVGDVAGNTAGERWDAGAAGHAEQAGLEESYEIIPRPSEEVNVPADSVATSAQKTKGLDWADEPAAAELGTGNQAGEAWDAKAAGDQTDNSWAAEPVTQAGAAVPADDGFHEVPGRHRGRGGHRGRGDGEGRGRGGRGGYRRGRGDGEFRGGRGGPRGRGDGEYRGRGGRGSRGGPRGGGDAARGGS